ncbi:MAG: TSUP family transporter [Pseudomonadota bacterium]
MSEALANLHQVLALSGAQWWACAAAVTLSAFVQRLSGQAFGIVAAPLVALAAPEYLPAGLLLLGIVVGITSTAVDLSAVTAREFWPGAAGRALGAVLAALVAAQLTSPRLLAALIAAIVLLAIALSLSGLRAPIRTSTLSIAGVAAGLMGTLTAVGAPPMALLYQHEPAKRARAMQNAFFCWGMVVSVLALWWQGLVTARHITFSASLIPAIALGLLVSMPVARRMERRAIRPFALGLSALAAVTLLVRVIAYA